MYITVGWTWWRHQRAPCLVLPRAPPTLNPPLDLHILYSWNYHSHKLITKLLIVIGVCNWLILNHMIAVNAGLEKIVQKRFIKNIKWWFCFLLLVFRFVSESVITLFCSFTPDWSWVTCFKMLLAPVLNFFIFFFYQIRGHHAVCENEETVHNFIGCSDNVVQENIRLVSDNVVQENIRLVQYTPSRMTLCAQLLLHNRRAFFIEWL